MCSPYIGKRVVLLRTRAGMDSAHAYARSQESSRLGSMDRFEQFVPSAAALLLRYRGPGRRSCHARCRMQSPVRPPAQRAVRPSIVDSRENLKSERQQSVAGKNRHRFAENLVTRRTAAAKIVVVECRQVVVNQRIRMDQLESAGSVREVLAITQRRVRGVIHRIGRIRLPPANRLYRIALWILCGGSVSGGTQRSSAASTSRHCSCR